MRSKWAVPQRSRRLGALILVVGLALVDVGPAEQALTNAAAGPTRPTEAGSSSGIANDQGAVALAAGEVARGVESAPVGAAPTVESAPPPVAVYSTVEDPATPSPPTAAGEAPTSQDIPGEWIVELKAGEPAQAVAEEHASTSGADVHHVYTAAVNGYSASMSDGQAEKVAADPRVLSVTRDRRAYAQAQTVPVGIKRVGAPNTAVGVAVDVDVAIVDTGIAPHPDLTIAGGKNCNGTGTSYTDGHGHGTHVAGTVAAKNDTNGVVGVAPGARLWAVRVLGTSGSGSTSQIICGLDWVRAQGNIEVVNMSLSGPGSEGSSCTSSTMRAAVCNLKAAGVTVVVAAGNSKVDANGTVPATYPEVITVSALADSNGLGGGGGAAQCGDADDSLANFSNWGADVDVIAPGVCINSTSRTGGYASMSGTSMASPHVAGAAAVYKAANPLAPPDQVRQHLITTGTSDWINSEDRDGIKEPVIQVAPPPPPPEVPPTPNFTTSCAARVCNFTDTTSITNSDPIASWSWSFGSGDATSTAQNPSFTFPADGTYSVQLTVSDNDGPASITKAVTVTTPPPPPPEVPPTPNFTSSCNGFACTFTDTSATTNGDAISAWSWNFGSGDATSTARNPSFTYPAAGTYSVQLTVTDNDGPASITKQVVVNNPPPPPPITLTLTRGWFFTTSLTLQWTGATGSNVEVWRKPSTAATFTLVMTTPNDGSATNDPGRGSWVYKVCQIGGSVCSPERSITI